MPAPVVRAAGIVSLELSPPVEFIADQIGGFRDRLTDFTPLWERFASVLEGIETDRFDTEGHGEWPELAPSTVREKTRLGFPLDILVRTGKLKKSLTERELAMRLTPLSMSWGTDVEYAKYHQEGTTKMPQRKVLDIDVADRRRLEAAMVGWIDQVAAESLGRIAA